MTEKFEPPGDPNCISSMLAQFCVSNFQEVVFQLMFGQTQPTPYDIEFSLFGIPARIHPLFWVITVLFGWSLGDPALVIIWVLCVFISILIHEMGHALMATAFGYSPHIVLHHMGGYASFVPDRNLSLWKSIAISLAGPLAGFVFFGLIVLINLITLLNGIELSERMMAAVQFLGFINLFWGLVNLLPVLPLDGGQVCRDLLKFIRRIDGDLWAFRIGIFVGVLIAILFYRLGYPYGAVMFGLLALSNLQMMNAYQQGW